MTEPTIKNIKELPPVTIFGHELCRAEGQWPDINGPSFEVSIPHLRITRAYTKEEWEGLAPALLNEYQIEKNRFWFAAAATMGGTPCQVRVGGTP